MTPQTITALREIRYYARKSFAGANARATQAAKGNLKHISVLNAEKVHDMEIAAEIGDPYSPLGYRMRAIEARALRLLDADSAARVEAGR